MPKNAVTVELYYNAVWNDITLNEEVFTDSAITILQGQSDENGGFRPCQITMKLNNASDKYRISNPLSPLYRLVGRNTPIRVSVNGSVRAIGEVNSWKCDQTQDFRATPRRGKAWTEITANGVLYRVNTWKKFIRSPIYRDTIRSLSDGYNIADYWDMEVPSGSSEAPSAVGGKPLKPITTARYTLPDGSVLPPGGAPDFSSGNGIPGADALPTFQNGGTLAAPVRTVTYDGYAIDWVMQLQEGVGSGVSADILNWTEAGTYVDFTVNVTETSITVFHANSADHATLTSTGSAVATIALFDGIPHHFRYQVRQSGANYLAWFLIDSALYATADNFVPGMTGTVGRPTYIQWNPLEDRGDYMPMAVGHLTIWASGQIGGQAPIFYATNGYAIEKTADRLDRLFDQENIAHNIIGTSSLSHQMGPQKPDTLVNHLKEIKNTEDGLIYDDIDSLAINFKTLNSRYNQTPVMTLYTTDLPNLPQEVTDTIDVANIVTARQRDGGEVTAEDDTSFLSSDDPPNGVGEEKADVDVNLYDPNNDLAEYANWWLRRWTIDEPRYPEIILDLNANPSLVTDFEAMVPGDVIEITDMREYVIRLFVLGWTEVIGTHSRKVSLICKPDQQFNIGQYDSTSKRYDVETATLSGAHSLATTTLSITMSKNESWSTTSAYEILIAGELIYVPIGAMSVKAGTGPYTQTATGVTRAVNGIAKILPASSEVHVANPGRYAL